MVRVARVPAGAGLEPVMRWGLRTKWCNASCATRNRTLPRNAISRCLIARCSKRLRRCRHGSKTSDKQKAAVNSWNWNFATALANRWLPQPSVQPAAVFRTSRRSVQQLASNWPAKYFEFWRKRLKNCGSTCGAKPCCQNDIREFWRRGGDSNPRYRC